VPLQAWVGEWVGVWARVVHCTYWDNHWMYLLARAAKDDWKGEDHLHIHAFALLALLLLLEQRMHFLYYHHFAGLLAPMHARVHLINGRVWQRD
jgi:hypothetical protein